MNTYWKNSNMMGWGHDELELKEMGREGQTFYYGHMAQILIALKMWKRVQLLLGLEIFEWGLKYLSNLPNEGGQKLLIFNVRGSKKFF